MLDLEQPPGWKTAAVVSSGRHRASTADVVLYDEEEQHIGVHAHEFTGGISCVHDGGLWHLVRAAPDIFLHGVCWLRRFGRHRSQCPHGIGAFRGFPRPFRDASPPQKRHRTPASGGGGGISGSSLSMSIPDPVTKPATPSCITHGQERACSRFPGNPAK